MLYYQNIAIIKDSEVIKVHDLSYHSNEDFLVVEVLADKNNQLIKRIPMGRETIRVEYDSLPINVKFTDKNGIVLNEVSIDKESEGVFLTEEERVLKNLEEFIKAKMDYPRGSREEINFHSEMLQKATFDKNAKKYIVSKIKQHLYECEFEKLTDEEVEGFSKLIFSNLYGMGVLEELDSDPDIGEIMVTASVFPEFKSEIYYIKNNEKKLFNKSFSNLDELKQIFSRTIAFENKELNSVENAIIEATRENKDRINIIIPKASENYILNIRKFANFVPDTDSMKKSGTINDEINELLNLLVRGKANVGIGGEMGTGKTTLINFLLSHTPKIERKVVIASVVETDINRVLKGHDIPLLSVDESKGFTFEKLMKSALRTTASRIIVPESRGEEFRQIYEANLKTKGNIFTAHALDDDSFLDMCSDMYMSSGNSGAENSNYVKNKVAKSIDIVIIMAKYGTKIRIKSISEILYDENRNYKEMSKLYEWIINPDSPEDGYYEKKNKLSQRLINSLNQYGIPLVDLKKWGEYDEY